MEVCCKMEKVGGYGGEGILFVMMRRPPRCLLLPPRVNLKNQKITIFISVRRFYGGGEFLHRLLD